MTDDLYDQAHREFLEFSKNQAWLNAFTIVMGEWMREIATYHQGPVQAIADRAMIRQLNATRDDIAKHFLLNRLEEIRKEKKFDPREHPRNRSGEFARKGQGEGPRAGVYNARHEDAVGSAIGAGFNLRSEGSRERYHARQDRREQASTLIDQRIQTLRSGEEVKPLGRQDMLGTVNQPVRLDTSENPGDHKAEVLRRAGQMTYALEEKTRNNGDRQRIQYTIVGPQGSRVEVPAAGSLPTGVNYDGGERIKFMTPVGPDNPVTVAGKVMDLGLVSGMDHDVAAKAGSVAADIHDTLNTTNWGQRLNNVANVARVLSNNNPAMVQANAVAGLVQILGPDAYRAFGPKMRQLTYRYTGQEAGPTQMSDVARSINEDFQNGELKPEAAQRKNRIEGYEGQLAIDLATHALPSETEYKAALQAGSTPPSKGYILDKDGKVITEAVGFSDDWYTPFNLKRLHHLKDGSYVRSRGYGGITPEDIQLAMHTGAKRVTVVSNSGVFSIEFDNRVSSYGHRFGFGGTALQRRYAKSLDAIKNNRVDSPVTQGQHLQLDQLGYKTALADLKQKYPYFVKKVTVNSLSGVQTVNPHKADDGYVRPLSIKASGAKAGWADANVTGDKQAYDMLEQYRLDHAAFGAMRRNANAAAEASSGGGNRPANNNLSAVEQRRAQEAQAQRERETRGEGTTTSSYAPQEVLSADQAGQELAQLRTIINHDATLRHEDEQVNDFIDVIALNDKQGADYKTFRKKWAEDPVYRRTILDGLQDVYGETANSQTILPNLINLHRKDVATDVQNAAQDKLDAASAADPDAPDDTAGVGEEQGYETWMTIPREVIENSPAIQSWTDDLAVRGDPAGDIKDPRAKLQLDSFDRWKDIQSRDHENRNHALRDALNPEQRAAFDLMHHRVIQRLNAERLGFGDDFDEERPPADTPAPPSRPKDPGPEGVSRAFASHVRSVLESSSPADASMVGRAIIFDHLDNDDMAPDETALMVRETIGQFEQQEAELRRMGHEEMAAKMASAVDGMREICGEYGIGID